MTDIKPNSTWFEKSIVDIEVICEFPTPRVWGAKWGEPAYWEKLDKELRSETEEFVNFIRDHRSRDSISMSTRKIYNIRCKYCGETYDVSDTGGMSPNCCKEAMNHDGIYDTVKDTIEYEDETIKKYED